MSRLNFEQFIGEHGSPECRLVYEDVTINSSEVDPSTGDYKPEYVKVPFCETHCVSAVDLPISPTKPLDPS